MRFVYCSHFISFHFILLPQSAITSSSNSHRAGQEGYKTATTARELRTKDKIKTLRAIGLLKHTHTHTHSHDKEEKKIKNTHKVVKYIL